jgi:hypothetical protein
VEATEGDVALPILPQSKGKKDVVGRILKFVNSLLNGGEDRIDEGIDIGVDIDDSDEVDDVDNDDDVDDDEVSDEIDGMTDDDGIEGGRDIEIDNDVDDLDDDLEDI